MFSLQTSELARTNVHVYVALSYSGHLMPSASCASDKILESQWAFYKRTPGANSITLDALIASHHESSCLTASGPAV